MQIKYSTNNNFKIISVEGRVDTITAGDFESQVLPYTQDSNAALIIDCGNLGYISSSGLRIFLILQKRVSANGGRLMLCSMQPGIREIFDISGFSNIFPIFPDLDSAMASS